MYFFTFFFKSTEVGKIRKYEDLTNKLKRVNILPLVISDCHTKFLKEPTEDPYPKTDFQNNTKDRYCANMRRFLNLRLSERWIMWARVNPFPTSTESNPK